jgi:uncharacterized protein VirK/YbjX
MVQDRNKRCHGLRHLNLMDKQPSFIDRYWKIISIFNVQQQNRVFSRHEVMFFPKSMGLLDLMV